MSTNTNKYGLVKPELTDIPDITKINDNWDKIDNLINKNAINGLYENGTILLVVDYPIYDGTILVFKSPCDSDSFTGLRVNYINKNSIPVSVNLNVKNSSNELIFELQDIFKENSFVAITLDITNSSAYILNEATTIIQDGVVSRAKLSESLSEELDGYATGSSTFGLKNDENWADLDFIGTLSTLEGTVHQGGCYHNGKLYVAADLTNGGLYLLEYNLNDFVGSETKIDYTRNITINATSGHGNGISMSSSDVVCVSDGGTGTFYFVDLVTGFVGQHEVPTPLSSVAISTDGNRLVLQAPGSIAHTVYYKSPYNYSDYPSVYLPQGYLNYIWKKGVSASQDICFVGNYYVCSLVSKGSNDPYEKFRRNSILVTHLNGSGNQSIYFSNDIPEPESITYDSENNKLIIISINGNVYRTQKTVNDLFLNSQVGKSRVTLNNVHPFLLTTGNGSYTKTVSNENLTLDVSLSFATINSGAFSENSGSNYMYYLRPKLIPVLYSNTSGFGTFFGDLLYYDDNNHYFGKILCQNGIIVYLRFRLVNQSAVCMLDNVIIEQISNGSITNTSIVRGDSETDQSYANRILTGFSSVGFTGSWSLFVSSQDQRAYYHDIPVIDNTLRSIKKYDSLTLSSLKVEFQTIQNGIGTPSENNIRPFNFYSMFNLYCGDVNRENPTTYTISCQNNSKPILSGTVDVVQGKVVINQVYEVLDANYFNFSRSINGSRLRIASQNIPVTRIKNSNQKCSHASYRSNASDISSSAETSTFQCYPGNSYIYFAVPGLTTLEEYDEYIQDQIDANTPITFVADIPEVEYDISPTNISILNDISTFWTNLSNYTISLIYD